MKNIKQCKYCGKDFKKKPSHSRKKWETMRYCSISCGKKGKPSWNKGKTMPEEQKLYLSKVLKGRTCNTGKTHFKKGQSGSPKTQFKKGRESYWKGKKNPYFTGSNNPKWKGGITPESKKIRWSQKYKDFRGKIFKRDNYTCNDCGRKRKSDNRTILNAHHIKSFSEHKDLRFVESNVVTLCKECHKFKHKKSDL